MSTHQSSDDLLIAHEGTQKPPANGAERKYPDVPAKSPALKRKRVTRDRDLLIQRRGSDLFDQAGVHLMLLAAELLLQGEWSGRQHLARDINPHFEDLAALALDTLCVSNDELEGLERVFGGFYHYIIRQAGYRHGYVTAKNEAVTEDEFKTETSYWEPGGDDFNYTTLEPPRPDAEMTLDEQDEFTMFLLLYKRLQPKHQQMIRDLVKTTHQAELSGGHDE